MCKQEIVCGSCWSPSYDDDHDHNHMMMMVAMMIVLMLMLLFASGQLWVKSVVRAVAESPDDNVDNEYNDNDYDDDDDDYDESEYRFLYYCKWTKCG